MAGWGATQDNNKSDELLTAKINYVPNAECIKSYYKITNNQFCGLGLNGSSVCQGDSGGPFLSTEVVGDSVAWVQLGIIATGSAACGSFNRSAVFTSVASQLKWILDNIN